MIRPVGEAELLIAGLLVAVAGLSALAGALSIPYPIVLVVGGALLGFVPGLPEVTLNPDVVLVVFLPPLLYSSAFFADFGVLRANLRAMTLTAVGLVLVTMCAVAWAAHALVPGMSWEAAFVARRDRVAHGPAGGRDDHAPPGGAAADRERGRGRGAVQRRDRARGLPRRRGRRRGGQLLALERDARLRRWRPRAGSRSGSWSGWVGRRDPPAHDRTRR